MVYLSNCPALREAFWGRHRHEDAGGAGFGEQRRFDLYGSYTECGDDTTHCRCREYSPNGAKSEARNTEHTYHCRVA